MRNAQIGLRLWILNGGLKCQCFIHSSSSTKQFDKHISLSFIAMQPGRLEVVSLTASELKSKFVPTVILEQKTADFYSKFFCIHQSSNRMQGQCYFSTKLMHRSQAKFLWVRKQDFVPIKVAVLNIDNWIKIRFTTSGEYYVSVQGCWQKKTLHCTVHVYSPQQIEIKLEVSCAQSTVAGQIFNSRPRRPNFCWGNQMNLHNSFIPFSSTMLHHDERFNSRNFRGDVVYKDILYMVLYNAEGATPLIIIYLLQYTQY